MYNRYIRGDGGTYTRISAEDAPLPPPGVAAFTSAAAASGCSPASQAAGSTACARAAT